jgi:YVTN family beta-propeller protein
MKLLENNSRRHEWLHMFVTVLTLMVLGSGQSLAQNAYIPNYGDGTVSVIDTTKDAVITTIPIGSNPFYVAVSPDGNTAYIQISVGISVINTKTNNVTATIPLSNPTSLAIPLFNRSKLYAGGSPDGTGGYQNAWVIDTATNVATPLPFSAGPLSVSPDGTQIYTTYREFNRFGWNYYLRIINTSNNKVAKSIFLLNDHIVHTDRIVVNTDGTKVFLDDTGVHGLGAFYEVDFTTNTVTVIVLHSPGSSGEALNLSGTNLYVAPGYSSTCEAFNVNLATNQPTCMTTENITNLSEGMSLTPDSSKLYITNHGTCLPGECGPFGNTVSVINVARNTVVATIPVGNQPSAVGQFIQPPQIFSGTPGKSNCVGQSIENLTSRYRDIFSAAAALGFGSATLLQNALTVYCAQPSS